MKRVLDGKKATVLFLLCWVAYFSSYLGRLNYSSAMSSIMDDGVLTLSQAGLISMIYFFAYGGGQFCNGILGDKLKPELMIFAGLFLSGSANLLMGMVSVFPVMAVLWGINGYTQSMIWPPVIRIFAEKFTYERKRKYSVDITSSMAVGTLMSYFLSACALKLFQWHAVFYLAAGILLCISVVWIVGYRSITQENGETEFYEKEAGKPARKIAMAGGRQSFGALLVRSGLIAIVFPVMIHGILKDGITQWVPTYIYNSFDVSASFSVIITMILPLINLSGAYLARFSSKRHPDQEVRTSALFFGVATAALVGLYLFGSKQIVVTALLFAVITASMMAVNTLYVNMIPLHFEASGRVSTVSGFLNSVAYLGSAISTFTIGVMVEKAGWAATIASWTVITGAAFAVCIWLKKKKFEDKN